MAQHINQPTRSSPNSNFTGRALATTDEAASILNIKSQTMYKWACYQSGPIQPVRIGGALRWKFSDIEKLIGG